jgi:hypothetical protein
MVKSEKAARLSAEAQARINFARSVVPKKQSSWRLKASFVAAIIIILLVVILLITGSTSGHKSNKKTKVAVSPKVSQLVSNGPTNKYSSTYFALSLNYPKQWSLSDNGKGVLTITSPLIDLVSDTKKIVPGEVTFELGKQGSVPASLSAGTNLAVLSSSLITYTSPSTDQSAQTYISFVQYASTAVKGGLDGIYVTGNYGYTKDQVVPAATINAINPLVMATFSECSNKACTKFKPLTVSSAIWNTLLGPILTSMFESFVFK